MSIPSVFLTPKRLTIWLIIKRLWVLYPPQYKSPKRLAKPFCKAFLLALQDFEFCFNRQNVFFGRKFYILKYSAIIFV
jgi:hypothetical protein